MSMSKARKAVRKGAEFLDSYRPGWESQIDLTRLHMASAYDCVVGQLHSNNYEIGINLVEDAGGDRNTMGFSVMGFPGYDYPELDRAWIELINERLETPVVLGTLDNNGDGSIMIEGKVAVGGKEINLPPVTLDYLLKLIEANR